MAFGDNGFGQNKIYFSEENPKPQFEINSIEDFYNLSEAEQNAAIQGLKATWKPGMSNKNIVSAAAKAVADYRNTVLQPVQQPGQVNVGGMDNPNAVRFSFLDWVNGQEQWKPNTLTAEQQKALTWRPDMDVREFASWLGQNYPQYREIYGTALNEALMQYGKDEQKAAETAQRQMDNVFEPMYREANYYRLINENQKLINDTVGWKAFRDKPMEERMQILDRLAAGKGIADTTETETEPEKETPRATSGLTPTEINRKLQTLQTLYDNAESTRDKIRNYPEEVQELDEYEQELQTQIDDLKAELDDLKQRDSGRWDDDLQSRIAEARAAGDTKLVAELVSQLDEERDNKAKQNTEQALTAAGNAAESVYYGARQGLLNTAENLGGALNIGLENAPDWLWNLAANAASTTPGMGRITGDTVKEVALPALQAHRGDLKNIIENEKLKGAEKKKAFTDAIVNIGKSYWTEEGWKDFGNEDQLRQVCDFIATELFEATGIQVGQQLPSMLMSLATGGAGEGLQLLTSPTYWAMFVGDFCGNLTDKYDAAKEGGEPLTGVDMLMMAGESLVNSFIELGLGGDEAYRAGLTTLAKSIVGEEIEEGLQDLNSDLWDVVSDAVQGRRIDVVLYSNVAGEKAFVNSKDDVERIWKTALTTFGMDALHAGTVGIVQKIATGQQITNEERNALKQVTDKMIGQDAGTLFTNAVNKEETETATDKQTPAEEPIETLPEPAPKERPKEAQARENAEFEAQKAEAQEAQNREAAYVPDGATDGAKHAGAVSTEDDSDYTGWHEKGGKHTGQYESQEEEYQGRHQKKAEQQEPQDSEAPYSELYRNSKRSELEAIIKLYGPGTMQRRLAERELQSRREADLDKLDDNSLASYTNQEGITPQMREAAKAKLNQRKMNEAREIVTRADGTALRAELEARKNGNGDPQYMYATDEMIEEELRARKENYAGIQQRAEENFKRGTEASRTFIPGGKTTGEEQITQKESEQEKPAQEEQAKEEPTQEEQTKEETAQEAAPEQDEETKDIPLDDVNAAIAVKYGGYQKSIDQLDPRLKIKSIEELQKLAQQKREERRAREEQENKAKGAQPAEGEEAKTPAKITANTPEYTDQRALDWNKPGVPKAKKEEKQPQAGSETENYERRELDKNKPGVKKSKKAEEQSAKGETEYYDQRPLDQNKPGVPRGKPSDEAQPVGDISNAENYDQRPLDENKPGVKKTAKEEVPAIKQIADAENYDQRPLDENKPGVPKAKIPAEAITEPHAEPVVDTDEPDEPEQAETVTQPTTTTETEEQKTEETRKTEVQRKTDRETEEYAKQHQLKFGPTVGDGSQDTGVHLVGTGRNIPESRMRELQIIDKVAKRFGFSVEVTPDMEHNANGKYQGGRTVYINQNTENAFETVAGHEMWHMVKRVSADSAKRIENIFDKYADRTGFDAEHEINAIIAQYARHGEQLTREAAKEELIANSFYSFFGDRETMRQVYAADRGVFERVMDFVRKVQQSIQEMLKTYADNTPEARMLTQQNGALDEMYQAMRETLEGMQALDETKKAAASEHGNGEITRKYEQSVKNATSKEQITDASRELARDVLKQTGNEVNESNIQHVINAAQDVASGTQAYYALRDNMLDPSKVSEDTRRGLRMLGGYYQHIMSTQDLDEWNALMMGRGEQAKYSVTGNNGDVTKDGEVKKGMDDAERYQAIHGKQVKIEDVYGKVDEQEIRDYDNMSYSDAEKELLKKAKSNKLIPTSGTTRGAIIQNNHLNIKAEFNRRSIHESVHKQHSHLGNIAMLLPVIEETYKEAVPVIVEGNQYLYTKDTEKENKTKEFIYLLGAFSYNGKTIPVQFGLKHDVTNNNRVYIIATIKEDAIMGGLQNNLKGSPTASSTKSIDDLIKYVKPEDIDILANIPAQFLSEDQLKGKRKGLLAGNRYINKKSSTKKDTSAPVAMTAERIDDAIKRYGAKFAPNYSKAYMAYISPSDFLALTTTNKEKIQNESRRMIASELREEKQTPFISYDQETGEITGHEGRHRMAALENAGVDKIAVLVLPDGEEGKNNRKTLDKLDLSGQNFRAGKAPGNVTLENLIPVNESHRQELIDTYGSEKSWFKYSLNAADRQRDAEYMQAVESGDEKKQQEMVKEAAKDAGFDTDEYAYHGTDAFGFTEFDMDKSQGEIFVAYNEETARTYAREGRAKVKDVSKGNEKPLTSGELLRRKVEHLNAEISNGKFIIFDKNEPLKRLEEFKKEISKKTDNKRINDLIDKLIAKWRDHNEVITEGESNLFDVIARDLGIWTYDLHNELAHITYAQDSVRMSDGGEAVKRTYTDAKGIKREETYSTFDIDVEFGSTLSEYGDLDKPNVGIYKFYTRPGQQLVVDAKGSGWSEIIPEWEKNGKKWKTRDISEYAKQHGYDSVRIKNVNDHGGSLLAYDWENLDDLYTAKGYGDIGIFFNRGDVKSADLVTKDDTGDVIPLSERFDEVSDIRYSLNAADRQRGAKYDATKAEKYFGTTTNLNKSGYLTTNGKLLDMSGKHEGYDAGYRTVDHRDIQNAYEEEMADIQGTAAMIEFMKDGNIRLSPESDGIDLMVMPNEKQIQILKQFIRKAGGEVIIDISDQRGNTIESFEYDSGTPTQKVIDDLRGYFEYGIVPEEFKYSISDERAQAGREETERQMEYTGGQTEIMQKLTGDLWRAISERKSQQKAENYGQWKQHVAEMARELKEATNSAVFTDKQLEERLTKILEEHEAKKAGTKEAAQHAVNDTLNELQGLIQEALSDQLMDEHTREVFDVIKKGIYVNPDQVKELGGPSELRDYRNSMKGVCRVYTSEKAANAAGALHLDGHGWDELQSTDPDLFNPDTHWLERAQALRDFVNLHSDSSMRLDPMTRDFIQTQALETLAEYYSGSNENDATKRTREALKKANSKVDSLTREQQAAIARQSELTEQIKTLKTQAREADSQAWQERSAVQAERDKLQQELKAEREKALNLGKQLNEAHDEAERLGDELNERDNREAYLENTIRLLKKQNKANQEAAVRDDRRRNKAKAEARAKDVEARNSIKKNGMKMRRMLENPSNSKYVPLDYVRKLLDMVEAIQQADTRKAAQATDKWMRAVRELKEDTNNLAKDAYDADSVKMMEAAADILKEKTINQLDSEELQFVSNVITQTLHQIENATKMIGWKKNEDALLEGHSFVDTINAQKARPVTGIGKVASNLMTEHLTPQHELEKLAGWKKDNAIARQNESLSEGQRETNKVKMDSTKHFEPLITGENIKNFRKWTGKNADVIDTGIQGSRHGTFKMTHDFLTSLYMHNMNQQNMDGMKNGLTVPDYQLCKQGKHREAWDRAERMHVTAADMKRLMGMVTEYDKQWAKAWKAYREYITPILNDRSMKLNGWHRFTVENYFPIRRDGNYLATDFDSIMLDDRISSMGFTKLRKNASNPMMLESMLDVVNRTINGSSLYAGMLIPVTNFNKVFNMSMPGYEDSPKAALRRVFGNKEMEYIERMMKDLQQAGIRADESIFDKVRSKAAPAALGANLTVVIKQAASYPTAAAVLGYGPLMKQITRPRKFNAENINKYSSVYWERSDANIQAMNANVQNGSIERTSSVLNKPIAAMDRATIRMLSGACEYAVEEEQPNLKRGSEEYWKAVARKLEQCVELTQPEYGTMQRPHIMRSNNTLQKAMTMFKTQSFQNLNIVYDAVQDFRTQAKLYKADPSAENKAEYDRAKTKLARSMSSQIVSATVLAIMTAVGKALLHKPEPYQDDKGEITAESAAYQLSKDALSSMAGMITGGSELFDLIIGVIEGKAPYDIDVSSISMINDLYQSVYKLGNAATTIADSSLTWDKKLEKGGKAVDNFLKSSSAMMGIPYRNLMNIKDSAVKYVDDIINGRGLEGLTTGDVKLATAAKYMGEALQKGDKAAYTRLYNRLLKQGKSQKEINTALKSWMKTGDKRVQQAADAIENGDLDTYNQLINEMTKDGYGMANVVTTIENVRKAQETGESEEPRVESGVNTTLSYDEIMAAQKDEDADTYTYAQMNSLLDQGNVTAARKIQSQLFKSKGTTKVKSALTSYWKPKYVEAYQSRNRAELSRITRLLKQMGYSDDSLKKWVKEKTTPTAETKTQQSVFGSGVFGSGFGKRKSYRRSSGFGNGFGSGGFGGKGFGS